MMVFSEENSTNLEKKTSKMPKNCSEAHKGILYYSETLFVEPSKENMI
jgi:hypothetical protein